MLRDHTRDTIRAMRTPAALRRLIVPVLVLSAALVAGWGITSFAGGRVQLLPGLAGCWRLDGSAAQSRCAEAEFRDDVQEAARGRDGRSREAAMIASVESVDVQARADGRITGVCHQAMHDIGRSEGRRAAGADTVPNLPQAGSRVCTAGYVHGLAEGYLASTPRADAARVYPRLCHEATTRENCAHGIGHALLQARADQSAPVASQGAGTACTTLPEPVHGVCRGGVYMELAMRTGDTRVRPDDYIATCTAQPTAARLSCFEYLGLSLTTNDVAREEVPAWCARAPRTEQGLCIDGWGLDLGLDRISQCASLDERFLEHRCVDGALRTELASRHATPAEAERRCRELEMPLRRYCTGAVDDAGRTSA